MSYANSGKSLSICALVSPPGKQGCQSFLMGGTVTKYPQVVKVPAPTWPGANSEEMLLVFSFHTLCFTRENSAAGC